MNRRVVEASDRGRSVRHLPIGVALALVLSLLPTLARAQVPPYQIQVSDETYQPLPAGATALPIVGDIVGGDVALPFPVEFFGQTYTTIGIGTKGYGVFTSDTRTSLTNQALPSTTTPNGLVAVWWDDSVCAQSGDLKSYLSGVAPARTFVVQWDCYGYNDTASSWQAQLWLHEGSSTIKVKYGAFGGGGRSWGATMGIENQTGTIAYQPFSCGSTCNGTHWPANKVITYSQGPDLTVSSVSVAAITYSGVMTRFAADAVNVGGQDAVGTGMRFWVSADDQLSPATDALAGTATMTHDVAPAASANFTLDAPIPAGLPPGTYYLLAEVDPLNVVAEGGEDNNVGTSIPFVVDLPAADMVVASVEVPTDVVAGQSFMLEWTALNAGNQPAVGMPYSIVLSANEYIATSDMLLGTGTVSAAALMTTDVSIGVTIPGSVPSGSYLLGIVLDPDDVVREIDELNNTGVTSQAFEVGSASLEIVRKILPIAEVGGPYCIDLQARGGDGGYVWSLESGALPPGLDLIEERAGGEEEPPLVTMLCGTPHELGTWNFSLRVNSAGLTAVHDYSMTVTETGMPLTVATYEVRSAVARDPYEDALLAVGGQRPYEWTIVEGELPAGIALRANGELRGAALADGDYSFTARVVDNAGAEARVDLDLYVAPPTRISCMTSTLPTKAIGEEYRETLRAAGGTGSYAWTTLESRRVPMGTDPGENHDDRDPPGLTLTRDGTIAGTPLLAGRYLWIVSVTDDDSSTSDTCSITFDVTYEQGLTVATTSLGTAYAGAPYAAELEVSGGKGPYVWTIGAGSSLPAGIELSPDGLLTGVLDLSLLGGESSKTFTFSVHVTDLQNRNEVAPLSLTLRDEPQIYEAPEPPEPGGCQAGMADPGLLALGVGLALAMLRRRGERP